MSRFLLNLLIIPTATIIAIAIIHIIRSVASKDGSLFNCKSVASTFGGLPGFVAVLVAAVLAGVGSIGLSSLQKDVGQSQELILGLSDVLGSLQETSSELALQGRNAIANFSNCMMKAKDMLENIHMVEGSRAKIAVFWPIFGADFGPNIQENKAATREFYDENENPFYYYLFKRFKHNLWTQLVFLRFDLDPKVNSPLTEFIDALSAYEIEEPDNTMRRNFSPERAQILKEEVIKHILNELRENVEDEKHNEVRVTENIPVLLFITSQETDERIEKKALIFIGNTDMIKDQTKKQGGFFTENPEMIEVLEGLFASLWKRSETLDNAIGKSNP